MQIQPSPLTVIIDPPSIQSGMPGDTLQLYVVVRNESNQGAVIDVFFDEASEILNQWCKSLRERLALAPQQSSELTFQFDIPVDALPGTYDYTLIVDASRAFSRRDANTIPAPTQSYAQRADGDSGQRPHLFSKT